MKKIIKYFSIVCTFVICNLFISNVYAATANIKVTPKTKVVAVGSQVTVTVTVSSSPKFQSIDLSLTYDSKHLSLVKSGFNGGTQLSWYDTSGRGVNSKSYTLTFKAKKEGTTKIGIKNSEVYATNNKEMATSISGSTLTIKTQKQIDSSKSSVNTLSSLAISGQKISPKFDKNKTTYNLTVPNKVTSVKVTGKVTDSKAHVSGLGIKKLSEGSNKISIVVTAENGSKKTYTINVTRKELNPITVKINDEEYTVVRNKKKLDAPSNYSDTTVTIDGESVPGLESETTGYKLVGLINPKGETNLYVYDDDTYTLYNEHKFGGITLYIKEVPTSDMIENTEEKIVKLGDEEITAYALDKLDYPLIYGMNIETGKTNWYTYDEEEDSLQRFSSSKVDTAPVIKYKENNLTKVSSDKYIYLSIILGCLSVILLVGLVITIVKLNKRQEV